MEKPTHTDHCSFTDNP